MSKVMNPNTYSISMDCKPIFNYYCFPFFRKSNVRGRSLANCLVCEKIMTGLQLMKSIPVHYVNALTRKNALNIIWM